MFSIFFSNKIVNESQKKTCCSKKILIGRFNFEKMTSFGGVFLCIFLPVIEQLFNLCFTDETYDGGFSNHDLPQFLFRREWKM